MARYLTSLSRYRRAAAQTAKAFVRSAQACAPVAPNIVRTFDNPLTYFSAAGRHDAGLSLLRTRSGLHILIRHNLWDAIIIREVYLDKCYTRALNLARRPTIVDIGAYIGDFSLYAAAHLGAQVIAYEPTAENFAILQLNISINHLEDCILAVHQAVGTASEMTLNVMRQAQEIHASSFFYPDAEKRTVSCTRLDDLFRTHGLENVDLLKIDCEGAEYGILESTPESLFGRIRNIVFEYHKIAGYEERLVAILARLNRCGYSVHTERRLVFALSCDR